MIKSNFEVDMVAPKCKESSYKISLLIPTYNSGTTLEKALNSIKQQSFKDVEVIIIDGKSTDGTLDVVKANQDMISVTISETDKGIYDAINKGIRIASGKLICVLGSDDELISDSLDKVFSAWEVSKTDIIAGRAVMVSADGSESVRVDEDYGIGSLLSGIPFCHNAMFVSREAYERVGSYDLRYKICADADWVHRAIRLDLTCLQIEIPVVRFSLGGLSSNNPNDIMRETYEIIVESFPYLSLKDVESLFRAIRGWSDGRDLESILRQYQKNTDLLISTAIAFSARSRRLAKQVPVSVIEPIHIMKVLAHRIYQIFG